MDQSDCKILPDCTVIHQKACTSISLIPSPGRVGSKITLDFSPFCSFREKLAWKQGCNAIYRAVVVNALGIKHHSGYNIMYMYMTVYSW